MSIIVRMQRDFIALDGTGIPIVDRGARLNHTELGEETRTVKQWYTMVVFGLEVLCLPNKSQGGTRPSRLQSWPLYYGDPFILNLSNHHVSPVRPAASNNMLHSWFNDTVPMTPARARK